MKRKIIRVTTVDISLDALLKGQLKYLSKKYEVIGLAADTGVLDAVSKREGIRVINVPMHREISLPADINCLFKLIRVFRDEKPLIVHANTPKGSLLSMVAAKLVGVPNRLYTVTGLRYQGASGVGRRFLKLMERITCLCATNVIPEGDGVKTTLLTDGITNKPLSVIHNGNINGIDTSYFAKEACQISREKVQIMLNLSSNDYVFVFVGRIVRDKGINELAEAMQSLSKVYPQAKLILVGPFEDTLDPILSVNEKFLRNSTNVRIVGEQPDIRPYLLVSDAFVFPSYREGFPNVVLEAGAMGLPAIVTDINGSNEIIKEGINGVIIPPRDRASLYDKMAWFIEHPSCVKTMSDNARTMITSRYEQQDVWNALMMMYNELEQ